MLSFAMDLKRAILIGECTQAHGLKGAFHFRVEAFELLKVGLPLFLRPKNASSSIHAEGQSFVISKLVKGHKLMVWLEGVATRDEVEALLPFEIWVDRELFPDLGEGEFYVDDLLGFEVVEDKTGQHIGVLEDIYTNGAFQSVFVVKTANSYYELPYTSSFFPSIDRENKKMAMRIPEFV